MTWIGVADERYRSTPALPRPLRRARRRRGDLPSPSNARPCAKELVGDELPLRPRPAPRRATSAAAVLYPTASMRPIRPLCGWLRESRPRAPHGGPRRAERGARCRRSAKERRRDARARRPLAGFRTAWCR
jgi:hypothetical protein